VTTVRDASAITRDPREMAAPGVHDVVLTQLPPAPARVLDLGSGEGALASRLAQLGYHVVACDLNPVKTAKYCALRLTLDGEWPFRTGVFDIVLLVEVIEHVDDPVGVMRRAVRTLRPGGTIVVTTPNIENFLARAHFLRGGLYGRWFQEEDLARTRGVRGVDHISPIHPTSLRRILSEAGATVVAVTTNRQLRITQANSIFSILAKLVEVFGTAFMKPSEPILLFGEIIVMRGLKVRTSR